MKWFRNHWFLATCVVGLVFVLWRISPGAFNMAISELPVAMMQLTYVMALAVFAIVVLYCVLRAARKE
jgi:branched-subunit amino acid transport protein AzlD